MLFGDAFCYINSCVLSYICVWTSKYFDDTSWNYEGVGHSYTAMFHIMLHSLTLSQYLY